MRVNSYSDHAFSSLKSNHLIDKSKYKSEYDESNSLNNITKSTLDNKINFSNIEYGELAKNIDVTNCTKEEIQNLSLDLFKSGNITEKEFAKMGLLILANDFETYRDVLPPGSQDRFFPTSNGRRNWLAAFNSHLKLEKSSFSEGLQESVKVTEILNNIDKHRIKLSSFNEMYTNHKK